jgi:hypothetical protein
MQFYHQKMIISGDYFEIYKYEKTLRRDFTRKKKKPVDDEPISSDDFVEENKEIKQFIKRMDSVARTRSQIRRIINSNPDFTKFVTLTFKENVEDVDVANNHFNKFVKRLNYRYSDFKYISIIEFQHRGAVHYHFLCNLPFIDSSELAEIWKHGFIKINKIEHVDNLGAYVCKYLQKDITNKKLFNKKKFFCSKNIEKPIEIRDDKIIDDLILQYGFDKSKPDYEGNFTGEYIGKVGYTTFKLKIPPLDFIE